MRLNRHIADTGHCSRREADRLIAEGRVTVNGIRARIAAELGEGDEVRIDGNVLAARAAAKGKRRHVYIALNKPVGITCTTDEAVRGNIVEFVGHQQRIFPIGRLDKDSEGLIILTNDGRITERLLHPRFAHEKEYEVTVQETIDKSKLPTLEAGIMEEGELLTAKSVRVTGKDTLTIVLTEGKKHQVRRMLSAIHLTVIALKRVRIMNVFIGSLNPGQSRPISGAAREAFLTDLGLE